MSGKWTLAFRNGILRFLKGNRVLLCVSMVLEPVAYFGACEAFGVRAPGGAFGYVLEALVFIQFPAAMVMRLFFLLPNPAMLLRSGWGQALLLGGYLAIGFCTIFACLALVRFLVRVLWRVASRAMKAHR